MGYDGTSKLEMWGREALHTDQTLSILQRIILFFFFNKKAGRVWDKDSELKSEIKEVLLIKGGIQMNNTLLRS